MYCFRISCRFLRFSRNLFSGKLWDLNLLLPTSDPCVRYFEPPSPPQQHYRNICKTFHYLPGYFAPIFRLVNGILPENLGWKMTFYLNIKVEKWHFTWISRLENGILPEYLGWKTTFYLNLKVRKKYCCPNSQRKIAFCPNISVGKWHFARIHGEKWHLVPKSEKSMELITNRTIFIIIQ